MAVLQRLHSSEWLAGGWSWQQRICGCESRAHLWETGPDSEHVVTFCLYCPISWMEKSGGLLVLKAKCLAPVLWGCMTIMAGPSAVRRKELQNPSTQGNSSKKMLASLEMVSVRRKPSSSRPPWPLVPVHCHATEVAMLTTCGEMGRSCLQERLEEHTQ